MQSLTPDDTAILEENENGCEIVLEKDVLSQGIKIKEFMRKYFHDP